MDVGGTMDPYFEPVSQLLTALHEDHGLRDFQPYYFHNCIYDHVYTQRAHDARRRGADRRRAAQARQPLEGASSSATPPCTRPSCSSPTATSTRASASPTAGHRLAAPHRRALRSQRVDQSRRHSRTGTAPHRPPHPPPLPDVPPERRRPRPGDAGAGRRARRRVGDGRRRAGTPSRSPWPPLRASSRPPSSLPIPLLALIVVLAWGVVASSSTRPRPAHRRRRRQPHRPLRSRGRVAARPRPRPPAVVQRRHRLGTVGRRARGHPDRGLGAARGGRPRTGAAAGAGRRGARTTARVPRLRHQRGMAAAGPRWS